MLGVLFSLGVVGRRLPFRVDPVTGDVRVSGAVEYRAQFSYNFSLVASAMVSVIMSEFFSSLSRCKCEVH